jgi:hypothetical protein
MIPSEVQNLVPNSRVSPIPNFPGYFATDEGQILSYKRGVARIRQAHLSGSRYLILSLWNNGVATNRSVHSLVLEAFVGPRPTPLHQVRHLNGIRIDNRLENLAWGTASENANDRKDHGTQVLGSRVGTNQLTEQDVINLRQEIVAGATLNRLAMRYNVNATTIYFAAVGINWPHVHSSVSINDVKIALERNRHRAPSTTRLSVEDVVLIRQRLATGEKAAHIAKDFNVNRRTISAIKWDRIWRT